MSDEQELPNPEPPEEETQKPQPQPEEDESLGTVSLLDLMADAEEVPETVVLQPGELGQPADGESEEVDAQELDTAVPTDAPTQPNDDEPTLTLNLPNPDIDNEDTADLPAVQPVRPEPAPLPLTPSSLKPFNRPPVEDPDATEISPDLAIPPPKRPLSEQPTQIHQRPEPPEAPTVFQPPKREAPQRDMPKREPPKREAPKREAPRREQPTRPPAKA